MNIQKMIEKYYITLGQNGKICVRPITKLTPDQVAEITAAKPEIVAILTAEKKAKETARKAREAGIAAIPGLELLRSTLNAKEGYRHALTEAMENEENDGVRLPARPTTDPAALAAQYPLAALWLRAEDYLCASNWRKLTAGQTAQTLILGGEIEKARETLENWLPKDFSA